MKKTIVKYWILLIAACVFSANTLAESINQMANPNAVGPAIVSVHQSESHDVVYVEATCSMPCKVLDANGRVLLECGLKIGMTAVPTYMFNAGDYMLQVGSETFHIEL
ncbi:MAG: hypothetical protein J5808_06420 [Paludibacteraceae bacterium]|nr:hypothetical protein [Paludibacteraceae bacterium]